MIESEAIIPIPEILMNVQVGQPNYSYSDALRIGRNSCSLYHLNFRRHIWFYEVYRYICLAVDDPEGKLYLGSSFLREIFEYYSCIHFGYSIVIYMQDSRKVTRKEGKMSKKLLTELYNRQAKIIYRYLLKYGCRKEEAEEIVQESFIKAIQHIEGVDERKLPSWIFTVALNTYRNYLKKKFVITELSIDGGGFFSRLAAEGDFTEDILGYESATSVRDCLSRLKDGYKDLLILKYPAFRIQLFPLHL